ncbi:DUF4329 domain-containing protein [Arenicella sp.]|nr:DUF4329 domain-containing protein [Arenicella sp.]
MRVVINLSKTPVLTLAISSVGLFFNLSSSAQDNFWQSPFSPSSDIVVDEPNQRSLTFSRSLNNSYDYSQAEHLALQFNQAISPSSSFALEYSSAVDQRNAVLGFSSKNLSLSYMQGEGEDYSELAGSYSGIDPYQFHGGLQQDFRYNGYALDYAFGRYGRMQFGQASVKANGLLNRKASYVEWSNHRLFARATRFARGANSIGNGFDAGFAIGSNKQVAYQTMQLDNGASLNRIRLQLNGDHTRQYWVDFTSHRNPLFQDNNDHSIMFSFKTVLGTKKLINYATEPTNTGVDEDGVEVKKSNTALKRGAFIGVGVVAAVALSSSGSDDRDDNTNRFTRERDAAFDVLDRVNPLSVAENREYGGWVVQNVDGSYSPTETVTGGPTSVTILGSLIPRGTTPTASIHTHAAFDPRYDNENFSPTDLQSDRSSETNGYLATPGGQFKFHNYQTGQITTLGSISN